MIIFHFFSYAVNGCIPYRAKGSSVIFHNFSKDEDTRKKNGQISAKELYILRQTPFPYVVSILKERRKIETIKLI